MISQALEPEIIQLAQANNEIEPLWLYGSQAQGMAHAKSELTRLLFSKPGSLMPLSGAYDPNYWLLNGSRI